MATQNGKRTTMDDIAKRLGISKNSVSLALNNRAGVSDDLRKRILETATELDYRHFSARTDIKTNCIVVVVPEYLQNDTFFYSDIFWSIEREAKKRGYLSITSGVSSKAEKNLTPPTIPAGMNMCGFLVIGILNEEYLKELYSLGFPIVTVDITYHSVPVNSVGSSNFNGAYTAVSYLIDSGHREIGFVGPINAAQSVFERWCGFQQALMQRGVANRPEFHIVGASDRFELLDTANVLEQYLNTIATYPTAWFCAGDRIAVALISLLQQKGLTVPGDISVIGYDDIPISQTIAPSLTTIRVNRKLMGMLAVERLIELRTNPYRIVHIGLPGTLIVRDSVRALQ